MPLALAGFIYRRIIINIMANIQHKFRELLSFFKTKYETLSFSFTSANAEVPLKKEEEIRAWLSKMDITNYRLIENPAAKAGEARYIVDVLQDVNIGSKKLRIIPVQFGEIMGSFVCSFNNLKSLKGAPHKVRGIFDCDNNELTSLVWGPSVVEGNYWAGENKLISLKGCPKTVNSFYAEMNEVETLTYVPDKILEEIHVGVNKSLYPDFKIHYYKNNIDKFYEFHQKDLARHEEEMFGRAIAKKEDRDNRDKPQKKNKI